MVKILVNDQKSDHAKLLKGLHFMGENPLCPSNSAGFSRLIWSKPWSTSPSHSPSPLSFSVRSRCAHTT